MFDEVTQRKTIAILGTKKTLSSGEILRESLEAGKKGTGLVNHKWCHEEEEKGERGGKGAPPLHMFGLGSLIKPPRRGKSPVLFRQKKGPVKEFNHHRRPWARKRGAFGRKKRGPLKKERQTEQLSH